MPLSTHYFFSVFALSLKVKKKMSFYVCVTSCVSGVMNLNPFLTYHIEILLKSPFSILILIGNVGRLPTSILYKYTCFIFQIVRFYFQLHNLQRHNVILFRYVDFCQETKMLIINPVE